VPGVVTCEGVVAGDVVADLQVVVVEPEPFSFDAPVLEGRCGGLLRGRPFVGGRVLSYDAKQDGEMGMIGGQASVQITGLAGSYTDCGLSSGYRHSC